LRFYFIISFLFFSFLSQILSEENFIAYPKAYDSGKFDYVIGLEISRLPNSIGEDMFEQLPIIALDIRYGLPNDFSLTANLRTIFLTNSISLGTQWSFASGHVSASIGSNFMYFYGFANFSSMDVSAGGYSVIPSFTVGYAMKNLYLTFKGEASVMTLLSRQVSDIEVETSKFKLYGWRGSFIIEQPVYGDTYLLLAFKINYTGYHYPSWLAFTTTKHWLLIPEFQFGFRL